MKDDENETHPRWPAEVNTFSIQAQLEEVERELALRAKVYPRMVIKRQMSQGVADYHMARMQAVADTLRLLMEQVGK